MTKQPQYHGPYSFKKDDAMKIYNSLKSKRRSMQFYKGRICFFFDKDSKYDNDVKEDGFVFGVTNEDCELVPEDVKQQLIASVFLWEGDDLIYYGDVNNIARYDDKRNIMLWG